MSTTAKSFLPALTGYRAIAAWMIFIYHFLPFKNPKFPNILRYIGWKFHIGVEFFFVLIGFLITYRYFNQKPINFKKYMVNRIARIYPMYFFLTLAVFIIYYIETGIWSNNKTIEAILLLTMTKALFSKYIFAGIPQGWTLTLEEMFYFTAPLFFLFIRKSYWYIIITPIIIFLLGYFLQDLTNFPTNKSGFLQTKYYTHIVEFFSGIGLGYIYLKNKSKIKIKNLTWLGFGFIILYLLSKHQLVQYINFDNDFIRFIELGTLCLFGIMPLIYGLINEKTLISSILSNKWMVLLGKSSYIFYLIHKGFIPIFINDYISDNKLVLFILLNVISIILFTYT